MKANIEMTIVECNQCGIAFAIPEQFRKELRDCHNTFYCPSGHKLHYPQESNEEKYKRLLREERGNTKFWREEFNSERGSRIAYQGLATKRKKQLSVASNDET